MKLFKSLLLCAACTMFIVSCGQNNNKYPEIKSSQIDSASYAIGVSFGQMIKGSGIDVVNYNKLVAGLKDFMNGDGKNLKIKDEEMGQVIQGYINALHEAQEKTKTAEEKAFFDKNRKAEGVQETESGLQYKIEEPGNDNHPTAKDTIEVHYKGTLLDGTVFDSSYDRGETVKFPLNRVIQGWTEGFQFIGEGGKIKLWIPFNLAYGAQPMGPQVPAYSTLLFDAELIKVIKCQDEENKEESKPASTVEDFQVEEL